MFDAHISHIFFLDFDISEWLLTYDSSLQVILAPIIFFFI